MGFFSARTGSESVDGFHIYCRCSDAGCYTVGDQDQGMSFLVWFCRLGLGLNGLLDLVEHLS